MTGRKPFYVTHQHMPNSILAAEVMCGGWGKLASCTVNIDIVQCVGCSEDNFGWRVIHGIDDERDPYSPMKRASWPGSTDGHRLLVDGTPTAFLAASSPNAIKLGDYGRSNSRGYFRCQGNIFEDLRLLGPEFGIDPEDPDLRPVVHKIGSERGVHTTGTDMTSLFVPNDGRRLAEVDPVFLLREPVGLSLSNSRSTSFLLKALATRAMNCCLVAIVVQCSPFFVTDASEESLVIAKTHMLPYPRPVTPLYNVMRPWVWSRLSSNCSAYPEFYGIRKHFTSLVNAPRTGQQENAINFFMDMFGVEHLSGLVGEITLFERMIADSSTYGSPSQTAPEGISALPRGQINKLGESPVKDSEVVLFRVIEEHNFRSRRALKQAVDKVHPIMQTLGLELLRDIATSFCARDSQ